VPLRESSTVSSEFSVKSLRARIAANTRWAFTGDRSAATAAARKALRDRFELAVDPEGALPDAEHRRRAQSLKKAHYQRLALLSAEKRRARSSR
jgi:hypothetical protein